MKIILAARRCEVNDALEEVIHREFRRLARFEPRVERAEVTLLKERYVYRIEAHVTVAGAGSVNAHEEGPDLRTTLDRVVEKLARQLRRSRTRRRDHQGPPKDVMAFEEKEA
ncbi:MAG: ribosome hibernation-promoting factor, HPF/YfiA family [Gemmatimonadota bacterium]